jgi:hypothetical protein
MTAHPNTIAAIIAGGLGTLTAHLLNTYAGSHITAVQAGGIATVYAGAILFIGRRGLKGTFSAVWNGVWTGTPPPPAEPVE